MNNVAKVRKRVLAALIDYIVYIIMFVSYIFLFGEPTESGSYVVNGAGTLPLVLIWFIYFPVIEGLMGQTLGKKIVGIHVVYTNNKEIGVGTSILRHLLDFIDFAFAGLVGIIVMKSSQHNQRIGDHVADTIVVEEKSTRCQFCNAPLSLNQYEFQTGVFVCPKCNKQNTPLDLIEN